MRTVKQKSTTVDSFTDVLHKPKFQLYFNYILHFNLQDKYNKRYELKTTTKAE